VTHRGLFITGTDTGVGKTRIATALCRGFAAAGERVAGMKPVASGCTRTAQGLRNDDALALQSAMNVRADYAVVNPFAFEPAIAPHIAALEAGRCIDFEVLDRAYQRLCLQSDVIIVEGAGGWLTPLDARRTFADIAAHWQLPVVLVVGLRLGCLNHALLTAESIQRRGLTLRGWVGNCVEPQFERREANLAALTSLIEAPCLGQLEFSPETGKAHNHGDHDRDVSKILLSGLRKSEPAARP
jgi:dethiobiotin synthetase